MFTPPKPELLYHTSDWLQMKKPPGGGRQEKMKEDCATSSIPPGYWIQLRWYGGLLRSAALRGRAPACSLDLQGKPNKIQGREPEKSDGEPALLPCLGYTLRWGSSWPCEAFGARRAILIFSPSSSGVKRKCVDKCENNELLLSECRGLFDKVVFFAILVRFRWAAGYTRKYPGIRLSGAVLRNEPWSASLGIEPNNRCHTTAERTSHDDPSVLRSFHPHRLHQQGG